jgi:hypothetical protein
VLVVAFLSMCVPSVPLCAALLSHAPLPRPCTAICVQGGSGGTGDGPKKAGSGSDVVAATKALVDGMVPSKVNAEAAEVCDAQLCARARVCVYVRSLRTNRWCSQGSLARRFVRREGRRGPTL